MSWVELPTSSWQAGVAAWVRMEGVNVKRPGPARSRRAALRPKSFHCIVMGCEPPSHPPHSGDEFAKQEHPEQVQAFRFRFASALQQGVSRPYFTHYRHVSQIAGRVILASAELIAST
jgi:hypothetical protein